MKKMTVVSLGIFLTALLCAPIAFAKCPNGFCPFASQKAGYECGYGKGNCQKCDKGSESQCPIAGKFFKKAKFLLKNQAELGLSDEQVRKIKMLKMTVKKNSVLQEADMKVMIIDIQTKMMDDQVDTSAINVMLDEGMTSVTQKTKATIEAYAELKATLSKEQVAKMKELWRDKKSKR